MNRLSFSERNSRAIRLWHWLTVIVTGLILFTVLVSKTFLNGMHTAKTIDQTTSRLGVAMTSRQIGETVSALRNGIWKWHIYYGYALSVLFVFRLIIEITEGRLIKKIRTGYQMIRSDGPHRPALHYFTVKSIYVLFYIMLGTIVGTGIWMAYYRDTELVSPERFHGVKEIHETCFNFLLLFIFIHLTGIIRAERRGHKNIVSGMIHGKKDSENAVTRTASRKLY